MSATNSSGRSSSTKNRILTALQKAGSGFVSGEALSRELDISRAAVWKAINSLREDGYVIKAVTNRGYRLLVPEETLTEESIRSSLPSRYGDLKIELFDTLDSTNLRARQLASEGAAHGTTVIALQQTAGRGRLGRSFFSPRQGLYLSIIVRPDFDLSRYATATAAAAVAVSTAIDSVCGVRTGIKWVNDIYCDGRKVCGILTEGITDFETGQIEALIVGIGVNTGSGDFPAALADTAGVLSGSYSRSQLAAEIISGTLDLISCDKNSTFIESYKQKSIVIGKDIQVYKGRYRLSPDDELQGIPAKAIDIDDDGRLVVQYGDGSREALSSGEITIRL